MQPQVPLTSNKKVYRSPELLVYGTVQALTKSFGNMGNNDGGSGSSKKTAA